MATDLRSYAGTSNAWKSKGIALQSTDGKAKDKQGADSLSVSRKAKALQLIDGKAVKRKRKD